MSGPGVRTMPGSTGRTGVPEGRPYVYRGTGRDIMPWAVTGDTSVASDVLAGTRRPGGRATPGRNHCGSCGHLYQSAKHHELCRGTGGRCSACGYRRTALNHRVLCGDAS